MKQKRYSGIVLWLSFALMICSTLHDANCMIITGIQQSGAVRNASSAQIGKIESNGTVRNASNAQIGKIDSNGIVRNASNVQIGSAPGVKTEWVAAFFFFDFFTKE